MALKAKRQASVPAGVHKGVIAAARETSRDFGKGAEPTVEIVIQTDYKDPSGAETLPLAVNFSPILNGLSALSKLLERLDMEPEDGADFNVGTLANKRVAFVVEIQDNGFPRVVKDTIRRE